MLGRVLRWALGLLGVLAIAGGVAFVVYDEPLPQGQPGPAAEALAERMMEAARVQAWERVGAVRFTFRGRQRHLWDRRRGLAMVEWGEERALLRLSDRSGLAFHAGLPLSGMNGDSHLRKAYRYWANDTFWLNPLAKLHDPGVTRERVQLEGGGEGLLVHYASGGVTPGDSYLWIPGDDGLPVAWKMWVKIIPIGGVRATWEDWKTLDGGAKVSTRHELGPVWITVGDIEVADTVEELTGGEDPFAPLL
jgi:hypothetical protein